MPITKLGCCFLLVSLLQAETHSLTLQQALELAAKQNPDVALARLDQQRAIEGIKVTRDPFVPKVYGGSGLAYTSGYPNSIEGNAPSIFEARTEMAIFNRPRTYEVAAARENVRSAELNVQAKSEEVAYQTTNFFLNVFEDLHQSEAIDHQLPSLQQAVDTMSVRAGEGAELPVEAKRARVNLIAAQQRVDYLRSDLDYSQALLAVMLGFPATDRVRPIETTPLVPALTRSEDETVAEALANNHQVRVLQSAILAKQLQVRGYQASRLPQVNLVAQYALFAKYNYQDYFRRFQPNNGQLGASLVIPLLVGSAASGIAEQLATDIAKLRIQMNQLRNRITLDTRRGFQMLKRAEQTRELATQQLELARDDLSVLLAQYQEGRAVVSRVEQARAVENERWLAMYAADTEVERARLGVLRQTGDLMALLRSARPPAETGQ